MKMASTRAQVRKARGGLTIRKTASPKASGLKASGLKASGLKAGSPKASASRASGGEANGRKPVSTADSVRQVRKAPVRKLTSELRPKKRRQRSKIAPPVRTTANGGKVLASRATAVRSGAQSRQAQTRQAQTRLRKGAIRAASRRRHQMGPHSMAAPAVVSVVPASESHALDWHEGSLAHQMDVRPHRSAM